MERSDILTDTLHGRKALVFDSRLFKDDVTTPLSFTCRPATIVCHYGYRVKILKGYRTEEIDWIYEDVVDVVFDHRPETVSRGHFTNYIELIEEK